MRVTQRVPSKNKAQQDAEMTRGFLYQSTIYVVQCGQRHLLPSPAGGGPKPPLKRFRGGASTSPLATPANFLKGKFDPPLAGGGSERHSLGYFFKRALVLHITKRFLPLLLLALPSLALAQTPARYQQISAGTGFVVNAQGDVITNEHVVRGCQSIHIGTAGGNRVPARFVYGDAGADLALLRTNPGSTPGMAVLRSNTQGIAVGDAVVVAGFPGRTNLTGDYQLRGGHITRLTGPEGEAKWMQLANRTEKGDSGGPVLDAAGNVVGVTSGLAMLYRQDNAGKTPPTLIRQSSVAITLPVLRAFLTAHNVPFRESGSGLVTQSDSALDTAARSFLVPVRCVQGTGP